MSRHIIAILRGITPNEAESVCEVLVDAGIDRIEVPLNSPHPLISIELMMKTAGDRALVGAGTVLSVQQVVDLAEISAGMVVSPNCNPDVIKATKAAGLASYPGVFTATECFTAIEAGADGLKLFPASLLGTEGVSALTAVLPKTTPLYAVGGVGAEDFPAWLKAGVTGFGIGSALYKPGCSLESIEQSAHKLVEAWDANVND
jgi:2-dehydro-3-deoxyphosphogalactonate aldolase